MWAHSAGTDCRRGGCAPLTSALECSRPPKVCKYFDRELAKPCGWSDCECGHSQWTAGASSPCHRGQRQAAGRRAAPSTVEHLCAPCCPENRRTGYTLHVEVRAVRAVASSGCTGKLVAPRLCGSCRHPGRCTISSWPRPFEVTCQRFQHSLPLHSLRASPLCPSPHHTTMAQEAQRGTFAVKVGALLVDY